MNFDEHLAKMDAMIAEKLLTLPADPRLYSHPCNKVCLYAEDIGMHGDRCTDDYGCRYEDVENPHADIPDSYLFDPPSAWEFL